MFLWTLFDIYDTIFYGFVELTETVWNFPLSPSF